MRVNPEINVSEYQRLYRPMLFALLDGLTQAQGEKGQIMLMDVHDASILSLVTLHDASVLNDASLEDRNSKYGKNILSISQVTNVEFIRIMTKEGPGYVEAQKLDMGLFPIEAIMPAVSYLAFTKCGYEPSNLLEWDGDSASLEDTFVKGKFGLLTNATMQLCSDDIYSLICFMINIGICPYLPNNNPCDLQELMHNELPATVILDWLCQVAQGKDLVSLVSPKNNEPSIVEVDSECVQKLKDVLRKSGFEGTAKEATSEENSVSGYTYVTEQDANHNRHICMLGYYPVDEPKYGILVWLQRKEQLQDDVHTDGPELGEYAAYTCKRVIEILTSPL